MELFDRITRYRYEYPNRYSSVKFIDYMITDLEESREEEMPGELMDICRIIRQVFGYSRYEPTNPYGFHKRVPAARNVHTNEAFLVWDGRISRYNCKRDVFERVGFCPEETGRIRLIAAAELWRIMKFYGEFGLVLPLLDAGHILAELKKELEAAGRTDAEILYGARKPEDYERLGMSPKSNLITLEVDLGEGFFPGLTRESRRQYSRVMNYDEEVSAYEAAEWILPYEEGFSRRKLVSDSQAVNPFEGTEKRESAHNHIGVCSLERTIPEETAKAYLRQLEAYMNHYMEDAGRYRVHMLYTTREGQRLQRIEDGKGGTAEPAGIDKGQLLYDTVRMIDMESMPVIVYISYLYDEALTEKENIYNAHIGAAEICHWFLLNGCRDGYFGRPMRNLNDAYVEKAFNAKKGERFMYSLILGKANTQNYVYRL